MVRVLVPLAVLLVSALAAPQFGQQQQAQAYNSQQQQQQQQAYQSQSGVQSTPVPIVSFDDSQPGDGTFKYR